MVSTSWSTKSRCEPSISAAIITEKPTPIATPSMPTRDWRTRLRTCVKAIENISLMARALPAGRARALPSGILVSIGEAIDRSASSPARISTIRAPRMPVLTGDASGAAVPHLEHVAVGDRLGRHQQRALDLADDDIGFHAHADLQRRVVGEREVDAEGLGRRIALRRDLGDRRRQRRAGVAVVAQQHVLPSRVLMMSSSLTSATTRSGFGWPTQNRTSVALVPAISPTSPSRRSTTPSIGARSTRSPMRSFCAAMRASYSRSCVSFSS